MRNQSMAVILDFSQVTYDTNRFILVTNYFITIASLVILVTNYVISIDSLVILITNHVTSPDPS